VKLEIEALGGELQVAKPSRVDLCADLTNIHVSEYVQKFKDGHLVTRVKNRESRGDFCLRGHGEQYTSITVGVGIQMRIYDKLTEVKRSPEKLAAMRAYRWDCGPDELPESATRCEFQLRREELKSLGIDTMDDWFEKRAEVCAYLCEKWFRFTERLPDKENRNQSTAKVWKEWTRVAVRFAEWCGLARFELRRTFTPKPVFTQLVDQWAGLTATLWGYSEKFSEKVADLRHYVTDLFDQCLRRKDETTIVRRANKKRSALLASLPNGLRSWLEAEPDADTEFVRGRQAWLASLGVG
jgi:hypothetical protein